MRKIFFSIFIVLLVIVFSNFVFADYSGNISLSDTGNSTVTGLTGSTAPTYCNVTDDCNGYRCYKDYDGVSSGSNKGWCYPFGFTSCLDDGTWKSNGYKVCKDSTYLATCSNGNWSLTACEHGCENGACKSSTSEGAGGITLSYSIQITKPIEDFNITQGDSVAKVVEVKNNGDYNLTNVKIKLSGISSSVYSVSPSSVPVLNATKTKNFTIIFSIPSDFTIDIYNITLKANSTEAEATQTFKLKVLPGNETIQTIAPSFAQYITMINELEVNVTKLESLGVNVSEMRALISLIREKLDQTNQSIQSGDYFSAFKLLEEAKAKIQELKDKISSAKIPQQDYLIYIIIAIVIIIIALLVYMFWPSEGYHPRRGYTPPRKPLFIVR